MKTGKFILPVILVIAVVAFFSIFVVKEINQAIVLQFGDPKRIILKPRDIIPLALVCQRPH